MFPNKKFWYSFGFRTQSIEISKVTVRYISDSCSLFSLIGDCSSFSICMTFGHDCGFYKWLQSTRRKSPLRISFNIIHSDIKLKNAKPKIKHFNPPFGRKYNSELTSSSLSTVGAAVVNFSLTVLGTRTWFEKPWQHNKKCAVTIVSMLSINCNL